MERIKKGFPISDLPVLFQQAVEIARRLGVFYLWIDALSIIQDDAHDWEVEAARMAEVYSGSFLTLAATHAKNSEEGMLGECIIIRADGSRQPLEYHHIEAQNAPSIVAFHFWGEPHSEVEGTRYMYCLDAEQERPRIPSPLVSIRKLRTEFEN